MVEIVNPIMIYVVLSDVWGFVFCALVMSLNYIVLTLENVFTLFIMNDSVLRKE